MKILVATDRTISWMPQPGEGRLYITDVLPPREQLSTAFGFVFVGEQILLTRLRDRDWDIPGGHMTPVKRRKRPLCAKCGKRPAPVL